MKKLKNPLGIVLLAAALAFSFAACESPTEPPPVVPSDFDGDITIIPEDPNSIITGKRLTADYDGSETGLTLAYQWSNDGVALTGETDKEIVPQAGGKYRVTISAAGYNPKTSEPVEVVDTGNDKFEGKVTIDPAGPVVWGETLTAAYNKSESETVPDPLTYTWFKDGVQVAIGITTYTPSNLGTGNYYVIVSATDYDNIKSNTVTVNPKVLAGDVNIQSSGTTVTTVVVDTPLTADYDESDVTPTYQWFKRDSTTPIESGASFTPTETGTYYVVASAPGYNPKQSSDINVTSSGGPTNTLKITMPENIFAEAAEGFFLGIFPPNIDFDDVFGEESYIDFIAFSNDSVEGADYEQSGSSYIVTAPLYIDLSGTDDVAPWTDSGRFDIFAMLYNEGGETATVYEIDNRQINSGVTNVSISQSNFVDTITNESETTPTLPSGTIQITMPNSIQQQLETANEYIIAIYPPGVTQENQLVANTINESIESNNGLNWRLTAPLRHAYNPSQSWTETGTYDVFMVIMSNTGDRYYRLSNVPFDDGIASIEMNEDDEVFPSLPPPPTDTNILEITMPNTIFEQGTDGFMVMLFDVGTTTPDEAMANDAAPIASAFNGTHSIENTTTTLTIPLYEGKTVNTPWTDSGSYDVFGVLFTDGPPRIYKADAVNFSGLVTPVTIAAGDEVFLNDGGTDPTGETLTVSGLSAGDSVSVSVFDGDMTPNYQNLTPVAGGYGTASDGSAVVDLTPVTTFADGNYSILVTVGSTYRYENGVSFTGGSASVTWSSMNDITDLVGGGVVVPGSAGLTITDMPSGTFGVYIVPGPVEATNVAIAMMSFVAVGASSNVSGNKVNLMTTGATGGTFNKEGTYSVVYFGGSAYKWQNNVQFSGGNATVTLSAMSSM